MMIDERIEASADPASAARTESHVALEAVRDALRGLRFGQVTVIVQDGLVVQVDRIEKRRLRGRGT